MPQLDLAKLKLKTKNTEKNSRLLSSENEDSPLILLNWRSGTDLSVIWMLRT
ncbi:hypothetical protein MTR67_028203 [Solanum verrucosum]|uniref:Uncharacterized protein n=1 Tax=Solanum verrucosum TaxID=315347 RepID=A0AAF0R676_SOLVR|nr:hypothetical protein MTR67_028203 [Solanum verrucosum]